MVVKYVTFCTYQLKTVGNGIISVCLLDCCEFVFVSFYIVVRAVRTLYLIVVGVVIIVVILR